MPISINLLAEDQELEEQRRKNPIKRALWISGFVVFLMLLWGLTLFLKILVAQSELSSFERQWTDLSKKVKQVDDARKRVRDTESKLSALTQFTTNRFLWANTLNALQQTCVEHARLVRFRGEQTFVQKERAKAPNAGPPGATPTPPAGASSAPAPAAAASTKPATAVERIVVHLEGIDTAARPGDQVPRYKETLLAFPFFEAELQKTNSIRLTSLSAPQTDPLTKAPYIQFGLQLSFQEKERRLYE